MELRISKIPTTRLDKVRQKRIEEYINLQEDFLKLAKKGIVSTIIVNKLQNELDIDKLTEWQINALDACKSNADKEIIIEKYPHTDVWYPHYIIRPYIVMVEWERFEKSLDVLETNHIQIINGAIKDKIDTYNLFINQEKDVQSIK